MFQMQTCFALRFIASLASIAAAGAAWAAAPSTDSGVTPADQVQFQQKTVEAQMQELQNRMFHLAQLTRENEPDDAARLLMAVRKAREDLILEQMRDVLDQLSRADLSKAANEQSQILLKLEELKKLLTSTDLDLQMQLERLRMLSSAISKLDAATREETRQRDRSGELSQKKADVKEMAAPQQEQRQNRSATESIVEMLKDLGAAPSKAAGVLGGACQNMSLAEGQLGAGNPSSAQGSQSQALDGMKTAREQLEAERQRILDELQGQVRKQVIENLTEMLDRQKSVRGATEAIAGRLPSGEEQTVQRVRQLAAPEAAIIRICDQTTDLITETDFSIALPPALREIRQSCSSVHERLASGVANQPLVGDEKQIEQDLHDLLDTFKQLASQPGNGNCRGCKGNKNKLLAELKVVRMMQARVNATTARIDGSRGSRQAASAATDPNGDVSVLRQSQQDVEMTTQKIHQEIFGD